MSFANIFVIFFIGVKYKRSSSAACWIIGMPLFLMERKNLLALKRQAALWL